MGAGTPLHMEAAAQGRAVNDRRPGTISAAGAAPEIVRYQR